MSGALDGIRVIDFGQYLAGPLLAMMLADNGADVIRADPPGGPRWQDHANAILQRGKRSIVLDLKQPDDQSIARRLIGSADIVVENFRPGVMDRLGLGPQAMTEANPRLIYCSIPGFASDDPRAALPGYEGVVSAAAGIYFTPSWTPEVDDPVYNPIPYSSNFATFRAAQSVMAALIARQRGGRGQWIEVPLFDATFEVIGLGGDRFPNKPPSRHDVSAQTRATVSHFECADGVFVHLSWLEGKQVERFVERFGSPEWRAAGLTDEHKINTDPAVSAELKRRLAEVFKTKPAAEWARIANPESDLAECLTTEDWLRREEQARATRAVIDLTDPELGETAQAGYPVAFSATPSEAQGPRHALDADRAAILAELDALPAQPAISASGQKTPLKSALEGIRVVDVAQVLAGPSAGRILAEFGADVVKINNPYGRPFAGYHHYVNTGKRTMLVDLKAPEGMEILWRLVDKADIFSMNFLRPAAQRLGVDYEDVRQRRPDIVYSAISCYGWEGPRGTHKGHEQLGQAVTGMQVRWGEGFREPIMQPMAVCDYGTGNLAAYGILLGLFHKLRTGEGQYVGASLAQTGTWHQVPFMIDYAGRVWNEPAGQQAKGWGALYRLYRASDRWLFLAAPDANGLRRVAGVEGLHGIDQAGGQLETVLVQRFAAAPAATWVARLAAADIGAHVLRDIQENMDDAWVKQHNLSVERDYPGIGTIRTVGPSGRLSVTPLRVNYASPPPGTDNRAVLQEIGLGNSIEELESSGAIADHVGDRASVPA